MPNNDDFDLQGFLPYLLNQAAEQSSMKFHQIYKDRYGMLRTEWRVLFHLGLYGRMTAGEIVEAAKTHKTKISRAVHKLAERRFLVRERDTSDRRVEHLELTQLGRNVYTDLHHVAERYDAALTEPLTRQELAVLRGALMKLAHARSKPAV